MQRWFRISALFALVALPLFALPAQSPAPADDATAAAAAATPQKHKGGGGLLQNLQDLVEQQSKQIESQSRQIQALEKQIDIQSQSVENLNRQFAHLTELLETVAAHSAAQAAPAPAPAPAPVVETATPAAPPAQEAPAAASSPAVAAAPTPIGSTYVVKKGENLISIAHRCGTTPGVLLKLNKISDERKLQIGQTLILPSPANGASPASGPSTSPAVSPNPQNESQ